MLRHRRRTLQIFQPYTHLSPALRDSIGLKGIRKLVLKRGDFIEDRFGQVGAPTSILHPSDLIGSVLTSNLFVLFTFSPTRHARRKSGIFCSREP